MKITDTTRALVTGANGGLGQAIARALSQRGAKLMLSGRRADALEPICAELGAEVCIADLAERGHVDQLNQAVVDCDVLVLNAALPASGMLDDFEPEHIDRALDVNLRAPIFAARAASLAMAKRGRGHIVFISSIAGKVSATGSALYSATKFGLRGFSLGLRADMRASGVGVSTIFPGFIRDAGLFAMTGVELPRGAGTRSPDDVARAVVRAIEGNVAEIDVAAFEQRLGGWLAHFFPDLVDATSRALGATKISAQIAAGQRSKR
jgi:NADP-dependent 3-hydroxy acid dehydrogenase YdfG